MLHRDALVRKIARDQEARVPLPASVDPEIQKARKTHGCVPPPAWTGASYRDLADLGMGQTGAGPMLLLVGDPLMLDDGLGKDEIGPAPLRALLPALPADITGLADQPTGATGYYEM